MPPYYTCSFIPEPDLACDRLGKSALPEMLLLVRRAAILGNDVDALILGIQYGCFRVALRTLIEPLMHFVGQCMLPTYSHHDSVRYLDKGLGRVAHLINFCA